MSPRENRDTRLARGTVPPPAKTLGDEPRLKSGDLIADSYLVRHRISADNAGEVYEAWDVLLERMIALKVSRRRGPLLEQAREMSAIDHEIVPAVFGMHSHEECEVLALEWISGVTVSDYCEQALASELPVDFAIELERAVRLVRACAEGLAAIHRAGLSRGELRPSNALVTGEGRVVFRGFGLPSTEVPSNEQLSSRAQRELADLHGLGAIAFSLLTGRPPTAVDLLRLVSPGPQGPERELRRLRPDAPQELFDLVFELLAPTSVVDHDAAEVGRQLEVIERRITRVERKPATALLVGDRARALSSRILRAHANIEVTHVRDAADAIDLVRRHPPALLVLDVNLPGTMSGPELCMFLSSNAYDPCCTVALTDTVKPDDVAFLERLGVDELLSVGLPTTATRVAGYARDVASEQPRREKRVARVIG